MAMLLFEERGQLLFALVTLSFAVSSPVYANRPPEIDITLPYTGKKGVLTFSEEIPISSYLAIMEVRDPDADIGGEVDCRTDNKYINVRLVYPKTYKIELFRELDRETDEAFEVRILCSDKGVPSLTSSASFSIEVMDANDNAPIFSESSYSINITEGSEVATLITIVTATDNDLELNGVVRYSLHSDLTDASSNFTIDNKTGEIFTNTEIDRESIDQYIITVIATDSGLPALSSSVQVKIQVGDINDNPPVIHTKEIHVKENQKPMEVVGVLVGSDSDTGKNAELVFFKVENSQSSTTPFLVNSKGEILSAVSLDREQRPQYSMEVGVRDKGSPRQSSITTITITITDVNDNDPVFTTLCLYDDNDLITGPPALGNNSGYVAIDWYSPDDERVVYKTEAVDLDEGENAEIKFAIESVTSGEFFNTTSTKDLLFEINEESGEIFLKRFVKRSDHLIQILNISATDTGSPPLKSFCALNITINIDLDHLTTPRASIARSKPRKRGRGYRNGVLPSSFLSTKYSSGHILVAIFSCLVYITCD